MNPLQEVSPAKRTHPALPWKKDEPYPDKAIQKGGAWKLAVGLDSDNKEFLKEIKSQIAR